MTKQTKTKERRKRFNIPPRHRVSSIHVDREQGAIFVTTNNIIQNMLKRDGPKVRRSFDTLMRTHIADCSALLGDTMGLFIQHLPKLDDESYKPTVSRLLVTAGNTYLASIETARHGFRRQYGILARTFIEMIATIIVIGIQDDALERFHAGTLPSSKCVGWAKSVLEPLGLYYGMLSNQFAHVGPVHALIETPKSFTRDDEALKFITGTMRGNIWMLYLAAELSFHDEMMEPRYWKRQGPGVIYDPSKAERAWMDEFLRNAYEDAGS